VALEAAQAAAAAVKPAAEDLAAYPGAKIAAQYKATLVMRPGWSDRTSYVIAPDGTILLAFSDLKPDDHVAKTLEAVKAWRAKHPA